MTLPFLYQLQDANYKSLSSADFKIAIIDPDDSELSAAQVQALGASGKQLLAYASIGEAEDYRDYWSSGSWGSRPPSFVLAENPEWPGNYLVKFWEPAWQKIVMQRVDAAVSQGYKGIYLDIVDAYAVAQVKNAYPGTDAQLRQAMIDFVIEISEYAKSKQPGFMVVPQNAVGLLAVNENNPSSGPNSAYLAAIDGLGVEDLWFDGNGSSSWTQGDLKYIQHALNADKFVLATSYPTDAAKQSTFTSSALQAGLIPLATDRDLTGKIPAANAGTDQAMKAMNIDTPWTRSGSYGEVSGSNYGGSGSGGEGSGSGSYNGGSGSGGEGSGSGSNNGGSGSGGEGSGSGSNNGGSGSGGEGSGSGSNNGGSGSGG
ncbi:MAG: MJ1477/TM1410 family putative glycoside hydrolase, partial [Pikeienuella sp.]